MWGRVTLDQINDEHARQAAKGRVDSRAVYAAVGIRTGGDTAKEAVTGDEPTVVGAATAGQSGQ